jgi:hypothetical protein
MLVPEQVRGEAQVMTESIIGRNSKSYYGDNYAGPEDFAYDLGGRRLQGPPHLHANFGYALTCHKSQGSEWGKVLVLIETSTRPTTSRAGAGSTRPSPGPRKPATSPWKV